MANIVINPLIGLIVFVDYQPSLFASRLLFLTKNSFTTLFEMRYFLSILIWYSYFFIRVKITKVLTQMFRLPRSSSKAKILAFLKVLGMRFKLMGNHLLDIRVLHSSLSHILIFISII